MSAASDMLCRIRNTRPAKYVIAESDIVPLWEELYPIALPVEATLLHFQHAIERGEVSLFGAQLTLLRADHAFIYGDYT